MIRVFVVAQKCLDVVFAGSAGDDQDRRLLQRGWIAFLPLVQGLLLICRRHAYIWTLHMNIVVHNNSDRPPGRCRAGLLAAALTAVLATGFGCETFFHAQTGGIMISYAEGHMVPHMMGSDDLNMACETGASMGGFLMSFGRVTDEPHKAALVTLLAAGMCAEAEAWEADLRQIRAVWEGNASEARDARIAEQRSHAVAAQRFYAAFEQLEGEFGSPGDECPDLEEEDELFYLLGLSAGMLALVHDRAAEGTAGVPMDIPQVVARAAACLDNDRWWGGPMALQAVVWAMVPGAAPEGSDPWEVLTTASDLGETQGVRLARAFQVQILDATGRSEELREAIAQHAESLASTPSDPEWQLLDGYATRMILHISDRIWTADRGHRTPLGQLGAFWQPPVEPEGYDDLFDDLLDTPDETNVEENSEEEAPDATQLDPEETDL